MLYLKKEGEEQMNGLHKVLAILILLILILSLSIHYARNAGSTEGRINIVSACNNDFAIDLLKKLSVIEYGRNIIFSPYCLSRTSSILFSGARGSTAGEMRYVFHFMSPIEELNRAFYDADNLLGGRMPQASSALFIADRLWVRDDVTLLNGFEKTSKKYYGTSFKRLDFVHEPRRSEKIINKWIEEHTNGKIREILPPNSIEMDTSMILTEAVYFKSMWKYIFEEKATHQIKFHLSSSTFVYTDAMVNEEEYCYGLIKDAQLLELPYRDDAMSMLIILPNKGLDIMGFLNNINYAALRRIMIPNQYSLVRLSLPKFRFSSEMDLKKVLGTMGMRRAFSNGDADFSGIDGSRHMYIQIAIHKTVINVDERGTEAAAGTGYGTGGVEPRKPLEFTVDRPFIFMIYDRRTDIILFMGIVNNPKS